MLPFLLSFLEYGVVLVKWFYHGLFPLIKEKNPTCQHTDCNHLWEQWTGATQDMPCCLASWWGGYMSLGYTGCPRCVWVRTTALPLSLSGTQGYSEGYNCWSDCTCTGCVTWCHLKTLGQEQSVGAGISPMSFASGGNSSLSYTEGTKKLQAPLNVFPSLPTVEREQ